VRRRAPAVEQAGVSEREGPGTDRDRSPAARGQVAQRLERRVRRRVVDSVARNDDGRGAPDCLEPGEAIDPNLKLAGAYRRHIENRIRAGNTTLPSIEA
jgi:hypothetical protein